MKSFLRNKLILSSVLFILMGAFYKGNSVLADTRSDYYRDYFEDLGFSLVRPTYEISEEYAAFLNAIKSSGPALEEEKPLFGDVDEDIASEPDQTSGLLYNLTSEIKSNDWQLVFATDEFSDLHLANTIFICDSFYNTDFFSCDTEKILSGNLAISKIAEFPNAPEIFIAHGKVDEHEILIIPEKNLYSSLYKEKVTEYVRSSISSTKFKYSYNQASQKDNSFEFFKSWGFKIFTYAFPLLILVLIFKSLLIRLVYSPSDFTRWDTYKSFYKRFIQILVTNRKILFCLSLLGFVLLILVLILTKTSIRDEFSINHLNQLLHMALNPKEWRQTLQYVNKMSFMLYSYLGLWLFILILYVLPSLTDLVDSSFKYLFDPHKTLVEKSLSKKVLLGSISLGIYLSLVGDFPILFPFLVTLLLLTLYLTHFFLRSEMVFTLKEKYFSMGTVFLVCLLGIGTRLYLVEGVIPEKYQDLIEVPDKIVMLPYKKTHPKEMFFNPMPLENYEHPLYIDNFLVYHPYYPQIENSSLNENSQFIGSYILIGMDKADYRKSILAYEQLHGELIQPDTSEFFFIPDFNFNFNSKYTFDIEIACSPDLDASSLNLDIHYLDKDQFVMTNSLDLLEFPGCDRGGLVVYNVPVDFNFMPHGNMLFELTDWSHKASLIRSVTFKEDSRPVDIAFLKYAGSREVLKANLLGDTVLHVFTVSPSSDECTQFCEEKSSMNKVIQRDAVFDLGAIANDLKHESLIKNPFIIWSTDDAVLIRNEYIR